MELAHFWGILFISLHAMVPITLAAIGETIEESAGLFNIGLEGILLLGALAGALGAQASGSAVIGSACRPRRGRIHHCHCRLRSFRQCHEWKNGPFLPSPSVGRKQVRSQVCRCCR